jgi:hypothetical protein
MKLWGWNKISMALFLVMHFPKLVSMVLLKRGYEKVLNLPQSSLCSLISNVVKKIWRRKMKMDKNLDDFGI